jgi:hypothetical protein
MFFRIIFLLAVISAFTAATMTSTTLHAGKDERNLLALTADQKTAVRAEMRKLLVSVSEILSALNEKNMAGVEAAARKSGMIMVGQVEVSLKEKLTPGFMKLGKSVHVGFDQIADAARDKESQEKIIELLAQQTNRCTTCHAAFGLR